MTRLRPLTVRIAALALALASGRLFLAFGRGLEPEDSLLGDVVGAVLFGSAVHLGLFLSADASARPLWYRRLAFLLMLPALFILGASSLDAVRRLIAGNPMGTAVMLSYGAALALYGAQLVAVMRTGLLRNRRAKADEQPA
ncbi:MAG: hypothetical protein ACREIU_09700 [Planctomycetota bacterium]